VLAALAAELRQRSVPDPDQEARRLLPDADPALDRAAGVGPDTRD